IARSACSRMGRSAKRRSIRRAQKRRCRAPGLPAGKRRSRKRRYACGKPGDAWITFGNGRIAVRRKEGTPHRAARAARSVELPEEALPRAEDFPPASAAERAALAAVARSAGAASAAAVALALAVAGLAERAEGLAVARLKDSLAQGLPCNPANL